MTDGLVSSLRNIARMRKMTSGIFVDAADALEAKDKRIAELEAKFWGADENEKITASFLETTTKQRNEAYARIEDLNARVSELCIALGLLTTLNPDLEIHIDDPVEMAEKVVAHVEGCIKELEDELQEAYRVQNNLAARIGDLLDELEKNDGR